MRGREAMGNRRENMTPQKTTQARKTATAVDRVLFAFVAALGGAIVLKAALFFRLGPFGTPYSANPWAEFLGAVLFEGFGLALISVPFLLLALFRPGAREKRARTLSSIHIAISFLSLLVSHTDHEIQRFMGIHLSVNYLATYARLDNTPVSIGHAIADDFGGAWSAYLLLGVPVLFLILALVLRGRLRLSALLKKPRLTGSVAGVVLILFPALVLALSQKDSLFISRTRSPALLVLHEVAKLLVKDQRPDRIDASISTFQSMWRQADASQRWEFLGTDYPLRKRPSAPCRKPDELPNFIFLQLETFRARDMQLYRPEIEIAPTPFIDSLARDPRGAHFVNFFGNGIPTVYSFMAIQTGILPHSHRSVAMAFDKTPMEGFTEFLKDTGYHTAFFSGPDPNWDNETYWINKWYDYLVYRGEYGEIDRPMFREAAKYLVDKGSDGPFFTVIVSISNHIPFRSPEPELDINQGETVIDCLRNTMRYTDDVVREFVERIENEPWFDNTILVITGDHGYDLGERGAMIGQSNLRRETTWVPLVIYGANAALPRGPQHAIGSHIDLAPTLLELAGLCRENSFMGHSLLGANRADTYAIAIRDRNAMLTTPNFQSYFPVGAEAMLFAPLDIDQLDNIAASHKDTVREYRARVDALMEVADWVYEKDRIVPDE